MPLHAHIVLREHINRQQAKALAYHAQQIFGPPQALRNAHYAFPGVTLIHLVLFVLPVELVNIPVCIFLLEVSLEMDIQLPIIILCQSSIPLL